MKTKKIVGVSQCDHRIMIKNVGVRCCIRRYGHKEETHITLVSIVSPTAMWEWKCPEDEKMSHGG